MRLESSAFNHNGAIDKKYTCDGPDISMPLAWSDVPERTKSLALVVDDPDAPDPDAPRRVWVHWILYNIPPSVSQLAEGAADDLPAGARTGANDWDRYAYGGPCPPVGRHRYVHKLYALDTEIDRDNLDKQALEQAMQGHILAKAELVGLYERTGT